MDDRDAGPVRVVIVDDHPGYARGLKELLESESAISVVGTALGAKGALELVATHTPDVVLVDVRMPETGGVEVAARIREISPLSRVLMLTVSEDAHDVRGALEVGAAGYLSKDLESHDIVAAIQLCLAGVMVLSPAAFRVLAGPSPQPVGLSSQDLQVLRLAAAGASMSEIAVDLSVSKATVTRLVTRLQRQLGVSNRDQMVALAARRGWV